jgi:predicted nucleic acid-binding protein
MVVDVSVAAKWFIPQERTEFADSILDRIVGERAYVPALFRWEMQNVLLVAQRANRLTATDVDEALEALGDLPISIEPVGQKAFSGSELQLARHFGLTSYDAAYLALAVHRRAALATSDRELCRAARDLGIELLTG